MPKQEFTRRPVLDPAVDSLLSGMQQKQDERSLTKRQKKERARMAKRNRMVVDVPPEIEGMIGAIAAGRDVSISGVVEIALREFIAANDDGRVNWGKYLRPSRSPRFGFKVAGEE